jgi:diguanylate cyclase (GGDEF)-like protein
MVSLIRKRARKLDLLFRVGGEEFMLLLPDARESAAAAVAQQLCASISESALLEGQRVTASIGVSELHPGETLDSWMKRADDAMYAAKKAGRDRVWPSSMPAVPVR